jgi:putative ABC transport system permease protein
VIRLGFRELLGRRTGTALSLAALLTATASFLVLTGTARTTQAVLEGDIGRAWDTPYDLLVRPTGSKSQLERSQGLVRPNYISGLLGGITRAQLASIRSIPGVAVAAPIAMVGFVEWPSAFEQSLRPQGRATTVYRITAAAIGDGGLSRYHVEQRYVVISKRGSLEFGRGFQQLHLGGGSVDCTYPVNCFAAKVCGFDQGCRTGAYPSVKEARYYLPLLQPIVIAGIDPGAEARIAGLDRCVSSGRYLAADDAPISSGPEDEPAFERIPVLVSSRAFIDETLDVRIDRAADPRGLGAGKSPQELRSWKPVVRTSRNLADLYREYLPSIHDYLDPWPIWSAGDVAYQGDPPVGGAGAPASALAAVVGDPRLSIYQRANQYSEVGIADQLLIPPEARDACFRSVTNHQDGFEPVPGTKYRSKIWNEVGRYDPTCLPGFDPLAGGGLETYSLPAATLPNGKELGPSRSMAGYVNSPPLLLTTLDGAAWLADPKRYEGQPGRAFISVIRVRVSGTEAPSAAAEARLSAVAARIRDATGLDVDIVKGSSTRSQRVTLPGGRFGRPEVTVAEPWWQKGVAIRFTRAVRAQDFALTSMVLLSAVVLVGESAFVSVRRRRSEFGVLRALGWSSSRIAGLVETEMLLLGLVVGALTLAGGVALRSTLLPGMSVSLLPWALGLPLVVAVMAGVVPALSAARQTTILVIRGAGRIRRRSRPPLSPATLGLRDLTGVRRLEALLGIGAITLALTVAACTGAPSRTCL